MFAAHSPNERYPLIVAAAEALSADATIDGEVVVCDRAGVADFERLQARVHDHHGFLYAFDLLELDGKDWRPRPLYERKDDLHGLLRRAKTFDLLEPDGKDWRPRPLYERKGDLHGLLRSAKTGIRFNEHLRGDGAEVFAHACKLGFEGIVSKDCARPYRSGRSKTWLKIKNPQAPGVLRFETEG